MWNLATIITSYFKTKFDNASAGPGQPFCDYFGQSVISGVNNSSGCPIADFLLLHITKK